MGTRTRSQKWSHERCTEYRSSQLSCLCLRAVLGSKVRELVTQLCSIDVPLLHGGDEHASQEVEFQGLRLALSFCLRRSIKIHERKEAEAAADDDNL